MLSKIYIYTWPGNFPAVSDTPDSSRINPAVVTGEEKEEEYN